MRARVGALLIVALSSCSLLVTTPLPSHYEPTQGQEPECSQSNWAAGMDMIFMLGFGIGTIAAADVATSPATGSASQDTSSYAAGAVALGAATLLTGYSMVRGFQRSSACRDAVRDAGLEPHGDNDWLRTWAVFLTIGGAALAGASGASADPDLCRPGQTPTALCRDGVYSCSLHRSGTCSYHHGVAEWL